MKRLIVILMAFVLVVGAGAQKSGTKAKANARGAKGVASRAMRSMPIPPQILASMKNVKVDNIRALVKELSADKYEGRGTGQPGGDLAAAYIANKFKEYGLKPAGDNGTYLQRVPMVGMETVAGTTYALVPDNGEPMELRLLDDCVATDETESETSTVDAPIVFVGYGINAPEYGWNDYKGADVKGKVALMFVNEPPSEREDFFKGKALTYYGRWTYKYEEAARQGAVGVILIHRTDMASYGWGVVRNSWSGERAYLRGDKEPHLKVASWIQLEVARKMLSQAGKNLEEFFEMAKSKDFKAVPLPVRLKAKMVTKIRPFDSQNVLAILPGADDRLKDEAVVFSSHYDHLGIRKDQPGDNIYNGAVDNATGSAVLIELARVLSASPLKPKRSFLFAAVTAEEQGLRGSEYLGKHSPVPVGKVSLNLNVDAIAPIGDPMDVEVSGAERTTFYPVVQATARDFQLKIQPDSNPSAGHYYRSDHFSMARQGVPAFSVNIGDDFRGKAPGYGQQKGKEYNEKNYHQPSDEYRDEMDFTSNAVIGRFMIALGWRAANAPGLVEWKAGDEFEAARKASR